MKTPILLITFNRPNHTRKVLEKIMEQHPLDLYVFQDGAREGNLNDIEKCAQVRNVIEQQTMMTDTRTHTFYSKKNLGCGIGPKTGISWFFENVEQGIVMEDDCLAHPDFFLYCEELLERYKYDGRISFIGGCNYQNGIRRGEGSYYYSMGHHGTWGWASWKRVWENFDYYLRDMTMADFLRIIKYYGKEGRFVEYWKHIFEQTKADRIHDSAWDYQFYFSCWKHKQLAIIPNVNLVSNIGNGVDATHTKGDSNLLNTKTRGILPLIHPKQIKQNKKADFYLHKTYICPKDYGWLGLIRLPYRLNKRIKEMIGHKGPWFKWNKI